MMKPEPALRLCGSRMASPEADVLVLTTAGPTFLASFENVSERSTSSSSGPPEPSPSVQSCSSATTTPLMSVASPKTSAITAVGSQLAEARRRRKQPRGTPMRGRTGFDGSCNMGSLSHADGQPATFERCDGDRRVRKPERSCGGFVVHLVVGQGDVDLLDGCDRFERVLLVGQLEVLLRGLAPGGVLASQQPGRSQATRPRL